jgi:hypothetical protein
MRVSGQVQAVQWSFRDAPFISLDLMRSMPLAGSTSGMFRAETMESRVMFPLVPDHCALTMWSCQGLARVAQRQFL